MYEKQITAQKQSEHQEVANEIGFRICEFDPTQQKEMLRTIRQIVAERMQIEIKQTESKLSYLRETFEDL